MERKCKIRRENAVGRTRMCFGWIGIRSGKGIIECIVPKTMKGESCKQKEKVFWSGGRYISLVS